MSNTIHFKYKIGIHCHRKRQFSVQESLIVLESLKKDVN